MAILTADQILDAPSDLAEETVEIAEWGGSVKIRSLTAAEHAKVRQASIRLKGDETALLFAEIEKRQVQYALVEPKLSEHQVNQLFHRTGPSWRRLVDAIDRISNTDARKLAEAAESFQSGGGDSPAETTGPLGD